MESIIAWIRTFDPKLVAAGVTYLLTKLLLSQGIDLEGDLIPGYISVAQGIALAAAAVAGFVKGNDGTLLREGVVEDGNPDRPPGVENPDVGVKTPRKKAA